VGVRVGVAYWNLNLKSQFLSLIVSEISTFHLRFFEVCGRFMGRFMGVRVGVAIDRYG